MLNLSRATLDPALLFLGVMALIAGMLALRAVTVPHRIGRPGSEEYVEMAGAVSGAALMTALISGNILNLIPTIVPFLGIVSLLCYCADRLSMPGILWMATRLGLLGLSLAWGSLFIVEAELPAAFETVALISLGLSVVFGTFALLADLAREAVLTHEVWRLPVRASLPRCGRDCR